MTKEQYLTQTLTEMAQKNAVANLIGVRLEAIISHIQIKANREIEWGSVVITLAELVKDGKVTVDYRNLRVGGPDAEKQSVPHYRLAK